MAYKGKKSSMETFAPNDKANYYFRITSITVNGKNAYELKGTFLDDLHNNAFSGTKGKDAVEHIEYYLNIIDPIKLPNVDHDKLRVVVFPISLAGANPRFEGWLATKFANYKTMDIFTKGDLWDYWKMGGDEIKVSNDESSDLKNAGDIVRFKTYEDYKDAWIYEWNKNVPWVCDKPWLDNGIWKEPKPVKHTCMPFNYKTGCLEWPTCNHKWYEALKDSEPKDKALRNKAIVEGLISDDESSNDCWKRWKSHEIYYHNYDDGEYKNGTHEEGHELCGIETHVVPICQIKRYKMIKYSFNDEEEYVAIKEDEYEDLTITSEEACRAYQEIFWMMDEGWMTSIRLIVKYLVNISKRRAFWSLNEDILKITILKTNTSYPSKKIRRTLGGKGSSLSSTSVFEFATASLPQILKIDPSALARLSSSPSGHKLKSPSSPFKLQLSVPDYLTPEEARASILLLLNKLLLGRSASPSAISQLSDILNNDAQRFTLDLEFDRQDDVDFLKNCWPDIITSAICALLDCAASSLSIVADAVAALSCEALKTDTSTAFNLFTDSGDGFSDKDRASVASDFKVLLNGSKMRGGNTQCSDLVFDIPRTHGRLRSLCKLVHSSTRVELNSIPLVLGGASKDLTGFFSSLAFALESLGEGSWQRAKLCLDNLVKDELFPNLAESFNAGCPNIEKLEDSIMSFVAFKKEKSYIKSLHEVYGLSEAVRKILSWEATISCISLEGSELIKVEEVVADGDKKKALGKGTAVLMKFIRRRLQSVTSNIDASSLFDLKDASFDQLLQEVKQVVDSNETKRLPKIPKGTRDFSKEQMAVREKAFSIITDVFKRHGALALDTPVFELRETLTGKYGEDSKLIYDLADQCDFDIGGDESIGPDFEVVCILTELLDELNIGEYEIKLNHRKLLDGMLDICGVPSNKFRTVCSSIDKLDKQTFEQIKKELIDEKGLDIKTVENIGRYVNKRGHPLELLFELKKEGSEFLTNDSSKQALNDLDKLFQALDSARCVHKVVLDLSLARGLDYYTGLIYEAVIKGATQVGSIAAGGRYDNLIGMFGKKRVAAIGVCLGIERVFTIMEQNQKDDKQLLRASETQVLVSILVDDLSLAAKLASMCWEAKLKAEFLVHKRLSKHLERAKEFGIPWIVMVREQAITKGVVTLKNKDAGVEKEVPTSDFVDELVRLINTPQS
ncbi:histidine--tRNA ligase, cytoplasmic [Tanacetum coccineum]